jgi:hypothetical protein
MPEAAMLGRLREVIRLRDYAKSTEKTYLHWTRRFLAYRRHAGGEGEPTSDDVRAFLTRLAMADRVSSSTQNQAFNAILIFFREVLRTDLDDMSKTVREARSQATDSSFGCRGAAAPRRSRVAVPVDGQAALRERLAIRWSESARSYPGGLIADSR